MTDEQAALIDRLDNPEWIVPGAHLNVPKTTADMKAAAECLRDIQSGFDTALAKIKQHI